MSDPRFFDRAGPFTAEVLATIIGADALIVGDSTRQASDVAPLGAASAEDVTFLDNKKYVPQLSATQAGIVILDPAYVDRAPEGTTLVTTSTPYLAYARVARAFYPDSKPTPGIHPSAVVDPTASVDPAAQVEPNAVIGPGVEIGADCVVGPGVVIGRGVRLGRGTRVGANAAVAFALVGEDCLIYPGARIGQDGFGFAMAAEGHLRIPQTGRVIIGNRTEIGANSTIDRGAGPDTVIGSGVMIDNLVQIGHNVTVDDGAVVVAQAGVAGSSKVGKFAVLAAQAGISGHLEIGDQARVGPQCGVMRDVPAKTDVIGSPAMPAKQFWRQQVRLQKLLDGK